jgi:catechol 2,3-dioxygenase-like lactoylglutathione lyase family enzyme
MFVFHSTLEVGCSMLDVHLLKQTLYCLTATWEFSENSLAPVRGNMQLIHIALVSSAEEKADRFYMEVLGLKKVNEKRIPATLSNQLFMVNSELTILNYANDSIQVEIFVRGTHRVEADRIEHVCLEVDNLEAFLEKCRKMGVEIAQIPKGDATITFIKDYDGNLFEIKYV